MPSDAVHRSVLLRSCRQLAQPVHYALLHLADGLVDEGERRHATAERGIVHAQRVSKVVLHQRMHLAGTGVAAEDGEYGSLKSARDGFPRFSQNCKFSGALGCESPM